MDNSAKILDQIVKRELLHYVVFLFLFLSFVSSIVIGIFEIVECLQPMGSLRGIFNHIIVKANQQHYFLQSWVAQNSRK